MMTMVQGERTLMVQVITSPGYPDTYPGEVDCYWVIRVHPEKQIYIKLVELELAESLGSPHFH